MLANSKEVRDIFVEIGGGDIRRSNVRSEASAGKNKKNILRMWCPVYYGPNNAQSLATKLQDELARRGFTNPVKITNIGNFAVYIRTEAKRTW